MSKDGLQRSIEAAVKKVLKSSADQTFESRLAALKTVILWYTASRKLGVGKNDETGSLLDEMRKFIGGGDGEGS